MDWGKVARSERWMDSALGSLLQKNACRKTKVPRRPGWMAVFTCSLAQSGLSKFLGNMQFAFNKNINIQWGADYCKYDISVRHRTIYKERRPHYADSNSSAGGKHNPVPVWIQDLPWSTVCKLSEKEEKKKKALALQVFPHFHFRNVLQLFVSSYRKF